jgi:hypothetical protein
MQNELKKELHQLIDSCTNETILEEAKELLKASPVKKDWWDELSEEDKNLVMESEEEYEKGEYISNTELLQKFEEWKKK